MTTHFVTGKTNAQASASFRQALMQAKDGDIIELDYGIECEGPFLIWSRVEIEGRDPGAHTLYASTSPVLNVGISGVTLRKIAVHYTGAGEGVAIQSPLSNRPKLVDVDVVGQVAYGSAAVSGQAAQAQPTTSTRLDFGNIEQPEQVGALPIIVRNSGTLSWHYQVRQERWLEVTPSEGYLHPDAEQTLEVRLNQNVKTLPPDQLLEYPSGIQLQGAGLQLDVPVSLHYLPPPPKLTRVTAKGDITLHVNISSVVFAPGADWNQPAQTRTIRNDSKQTWAATVIAPNWLSVFPIAFSLAPGETATLTIRPRPGLTPPPYKTYSGIIMLRDQTDETATMIPAYFDFRPEVRGG
jgi:hypothetical protein